MKMFLMIFAALNVAGAAGVYALHGLRSAATPVAAEAASVAPLPTEVYVPARELAVGTIIAPDHLGRMPIAEAAVTPEMVVADEAGQEALVGSVARQVLAAGVPIARSAVVEPGERGFLAAVLPQGKRAISLPISEVAGISGLVLPGDRVDIILTYSVPGAAIESERDIRASETVLSNLRVLALDQRLQAGEPPEDTAEEAAGAPIARTATLEVTPRQAEMITLATTLGELSLVLNSVRDGGELAEADAAAASPLAQATALRSRAASAMLATRPRPMTLDSDVTSLLQREPERGQAAILPAAASMGGPVPDRISRIQVVRGIESRELELGSAEAAGAATETLTQ